LRQLVGGTKREFLIVSPYFIPGKDGVERLVNLRRRGVRVIILTNSLASTDVAAVHAGYKRYRKELLRAGVELYENKPSGSWKRGFGRFRGLLAGSRGGSSRASLHAKTFTFDRRSIFVGSMNLDPRSVRLNTEIGILVECPELAKGFTDIVLSDLKHNAYHVELDGDELVWISIEDGKTVRHPTEPQTTGWQRFSVGVLSLLPLEGQL
ncbi:MAG: phospholipase D family protein, partial [Verrucomicrobiaceae bacterium]